MSPSPTLYTLPPLLCSAFAGAFVPAAEGSVLAVLARPLSLAAQCPLAAKRANAHTPAARSDGFGGGNIVTGNLIFNTCRESGDHGPINSWDRQAFFTDVPAVPVGMGGKVISTLPCLFYVITR